MMSKIIAVDFDGTLVTNEWPKIGKPITRVVSDLQYEQQHRDAKVILWTCRTGDHLAQAVKYCHEVLHIDFDAVNENLLENIHRMGGNTRKVYADEYWDDRAVKMPFA